MQGIYDAEMVQKYRGKEMGGKDSKVGDCMCIEASREKDWSGMK